MAEWNPAARGSQGPAWWPSRLTQIAEAPGEEPLRARGSRLLPLPPARASQPGAPGLLFTAGGESWAPQSAPQAGSEAVVPLHPVRPLAHHYH